ncbi:uncharacterized protein TRIADDRAFT_61676 [Trichoplax adhaerens]|uniref:Uncharacterized protein n=1 Tax=Trichoplax adhaerens TaxID=10228 RepID=B3SBN2_TRIAD|nr:predicted protein [Trichoplax adhaerens]EDV19913.1 predicted protein [Trichoplax adhaerens]|eukprot:XP_002117655.1 predicted protein [Trichoplax adhaerens]
MATSSSRRYTRIKRPLDSSHENSPMARRNRHQSRKTSKSTKENQSIPSDENTFRALFEKLLETRETEPERRYHQLELDCQERCRVSDEKIELYRKKLQSIIDEKQDLQKQLQGVKDSRDNAHNNDQQNHSQTDALEHVIEEQAMTIKAYQKFNRLDIEPLPLSSVNKDKEVFKIRSQDLKGLEFTVRYNKTTEEYLYTPCFDNSQLDVSRLPPHLLEEIYFCNCPMLTARILISTNRILEQQNEQS